MYAIIMGTNTDVAASTLTSLTVLLFSIIMISKLQGAQKLGELILMVTFMVTELKQFMITFSLIIVTFVIVGRQLNQEFKMQ